MTLLFAACIVAPPVQDGKDSEIDDSAVAAVVDADGDGFSAEKDCDDSSAEVNPAAIERCNGVDDNCDGKVDEATAADVTEWFVDADGDGWGDESVWGCVADPGMVSAGGDCDEQNAAIHPETAEECDGVDQDCDGVVDDACAAAPEGEMSFEDADLFVWGDPTLPYNFLHVGGVDLDGDGTAELVSGAAEEAGSWYTSWEGPFVPDDTLDARGSALAEFPDREEASLGSWLDPALSPAGRNVNWLVELDVQGGLGLDFAFFDDLRPGSTAMDAALLIHYGTPGWTEYEGWRAEVTAVIPGADGPAIVVATSWYTGSDASDTEVWVIDGNARGDTSNLDWPPLGPDARETMYAGVQYPSDVGDLDGDGYHELVMQEAGGNIDLYLGPIVSTEGERSADVEFGEFGGFVNMNIDSTYADLDGDGRAEWLLSAYDDRIKTCQLSRVAWQGDGISGDLDDVLVTGGEATGTSFDRFPSPIDLDGDGELDLALGDPYHAESLRSQGAVYLLYGPFEGVRELRAMGDATILGVTAYEGLGDEVATGDFNGDAFGDVAVGNFFGDGDGHPGVLGIFMGGPRLP